MNDPLHIPASSSARLSDILFERGVEFPCGGVSRCGGCRVRLIEGDIPITPEMEEALTPAELGAGWRLACCAEARGAVTLEVEQWRPAILSDEGLLPFEPRDGLGVVIDVGTTTLVAQLLDLTNGAVLDVRTGLNPQCRHGADVMSRIEFDLRQPGLLTRLLRETLGEMSCQMLRGRAVREVLLAGNTVMHHLFCGLSVEPLSHVPFDPATLDRQEFRPAQVGWTMNGDARIRFLPNLGGFVGSDILAGIAAVALHEKGEPEALIDLGTNGEIVVGDRRGLLCASTAAGPAFEAGRIRMGMRAAPGAIHHVRAAHGAAVCDVLGGIPPRGLCGSGLVSAAAAALDLGRLGESGRFQNGEKEWLLARPVSVAQSDIRELQLAKGAVAAGLRLLAARIGGLSALRRIHLAGAFGNYVDIPSARRIGLLPGGDAAAVSPAGNTSLRGVKLLLLSPSRRDQIVERIQALTAHVPLASDEAFHNTFVECMTF